MANAAPATPDVKPQVRAFNADKTEIMRGLNPEGKRGFKTNFDIQACARLKFTSVPSHLIKQDGEK